MTWRARTRGKPGRVCAGIAWLSLVCTCGCGLSAGGGEGAAGSDYEVLYVRDGRLVAVHPDGSDARVVNSALTGCREPQGSPDGRFIACVSGAFVYIMARDGSGAHAVAGRVATAEPVYPNWSPDGRKLCFAGLDQRVHVLELDATMGPERETAIAAGPGGAPATPSFLTNQRLLFAARAPEAAGPGQGDGWLYTVNIDGSGLLPFFSSATSVYGVDPTRGNVRRAVRANRADWIVFESDVRGGYDLWLAYLDGDVYGCVTQYDYPVGESARGTAAWERNVAGRWTPDGRIAYESAHYDALGWGVPQIWITDKFGSYPVQLTHDPEGAHQPGILVSE
ncbi:MAG TPA: hypothetical protein PLD23_03340 [Armatimonadota bacterium]|nr:hypothetical protein [Armatimonadota bacterium]